MNSKGFSIYIHIPFCRERCHYCDFLTAPLPTGGVDDDFIDLICTEIKLWGERIAFKNVETIYFGGGTPSLCSPGQIDRIIQTISSLFSIKELSEITMEANPADLDSEKCRGFVRAGINRISIGGQSSKNEMLNLMGRYHTHDQTELAVECARSVVFDNISLDLIYGMSNQRIDKIAHDLEKFFSLDTDHFSCYQLTVSRNHPWKRVLPGEPELNDFDLFIQEYLEGFGYERYEVSNYCRGGKRSRHNLVYWSWKPYLAIGPGAHGFFPDVKPFGERYRNIGSLKNYSGSIVSGMLPRHEPHRLSKDEAVLEYLMTHLRSVSGFSLDSYSEVFGEEFTDFVDQKIFSKVIEEGLVDLKNGVISPTRKGLLLGEEIAWKMCNNGRRCAYPKCQD